MILRPKVTISSNSQMVLKEGIIAHNDILSYEEFEAFMKQELNEKVIKSLQLRLSYILNAIKRNKIKDAYQRWEKLQASILKNKDFATSLLFISNLKLENGKQYEFNFHSKEREILNAKGKFGNMSKLFKKAFEEELSYQVHQHLQGFIKDIETQKAPYELVQLVASTTTNKDVYTRYKENKIYRHVLYGESKAWKGNVADAFMNHMAHLHIQLLGKEPDLDNLFKYSVFQEERNNINKLLADSKNNISWYTGGDVIIKYNNQIFSIQVKSADKSYKEEKARIRATITTEQLKNFIIKLQNYIHNKDIINVIKTFYEELKTSGWVEFTEQAISETVDQIVDQSLLSK